MIKFLCLGLLFSAVLFHPDTSQAATCHCLRDAKRWTGKYPAAISAYAIQRKYSRRVSKIPRVGSIALMHGHPRYGHSAAVVAVSGRKVTIKETGWRGCNTVTRRTLDKSSFIGFYY